MLQSQQLQLWVFLGKSIRLVLFYSVWYENGSPYLQKQGVCRKLSILAIDLCLQLFGVTYYHIWAYEFIRAGQADDLISRWLLPTFWLALWRINKINTKYVDTHRKLGLHRSWGYLICLPVTNCFWSPAPRLYLCSSKIWCCLLTRCRHPLHRGWATMAPWQSCSQWDKLSRDMQLTWVGQSKA